MALTLSRVVYENNLVNSTVKSWTSATALPFTPPYPGNTFIYIIGSGTVATATLVLSGQTVSVTLNAGNVLSAGSIYVYNIPLAPSDSVVSVSNATFVKILHVSF